MDNLQVIGAKIPAWMLDGCGPAERVHLGFFKFGGYVEDESPKHNSVIDDELDDIEEGVNIWELGRYA